VISNKLADNELLKREADRHLLRSHERQNFQDGVQCAASAAMQAEINLPACFAVYFTPDLSQHAERDPPCR